MNRLTEFREALAVAWRRMMRPAVWIPSVLFSVASRAPGLGIADAAVRTLQSPGGVERLREYSDLFAVIGVAFALLCPAVVSGLMSLGKAAVQQETGGWRDFWQGLGTYYWRVIGFYLLVSLIPAVAAASLGLHAAYASGRIAAMTLPLQILSLGAIYFLTAWMAAVVLDGARVFAAIGRAVQFAWKNPYLLVPAVVLEQVSGWLVNQVLSTVVPSGPYGPTATLWSARFFGGAVAQATAGYLYMFFILLYLGLYKLRIAPAVPQTLDPDEGPKE